MHGKRRKEQVIYASKLHLIARCATSRGSASWRSPGHAGLVDHRRWGAWHLPVSVPDGARALRYATRAAALLSGEVDFVLDPPPQDIARLKTSPIVNLWFTVDKAPFTEPFIGLVGSPLHWMFNRSQIEGSVGGEVLLNCTISSARACIDDPPEALQELLRGELERYFPGKVPEIRQFRAIKEKRATISHAAGSYHCRPETVGPIRGLYMAGDWVRTGLPATIESAVQSGHDAARALLAT